MRIFVAQINPIVGDLDHNAKRILDVIRRAKKKRADLVLFPELALCGYPPEDLLLYPRFIEKMEEKLSLIQLETKDICAVVGLARKNEEGGEKDLYNSAAILSNTKLIGFKDKTLLPTYDVFDERRYFEPGKKQVVFSFKGKKIAILICEDMWEHGRGVAYTKYERDPVKELKDEKIDLLLNLSASPYSFEKRDFRKVIFEPCAKTLNCPIIWCNQVGANDSLVFDGYSFYMSSRGELIETAKGFVEDDFIVDLKEKVCTIKSPHDPMHDLYESLVLGAKDYFLKQGFKKALIGSSGGIDSALVIALAVEALGKENVHTVALPSRYSSKESVIDAKELAKNLGVSFEEISIEKPFTDFLSLLEPHFQGKEVDVTEENLQARIRGIILMALSNKHGYIVISTANKSEMALGYSTLYGDMCGGLGLINDVKKTQVYDLCRWINKHKNHPIPERIITKAPSAELRPNQKDLDSLPEYGVIDGIIEEYVENRLTVKAISEKLNISKSLVKDLVHRIHLAEYKRRQAPPGIRVTQKAFSKGRSFPIVQKWN